MVHGLESVWVGFLYRRNWANLQLKDQLIFYLHQGGYAFVVAFSCLVFLPVFKHDSLKGSKWILASIKMWLIFTKDFKFNLLIYWLKMNKKPDKSEPMNRASVLVNT